MRGLSLSPALRGPLAAAASCGRKGCHMTPTCQGEHQVSLVISRRSLFSMSRISASTTPTVLTQQTRGSGPHSIVLGRHVSEALANGCPVVALESTVITHGLPEPRNLELALQLEREIAQGLWSSSPGEARGQVVPATVGIVRGQLIVGLSRDQIEFLARSNLSKPIKASRRDIPLAQACKLSAGTTVSATMALATSCSSNTMGRIAVFATGGLGGVHLGGERSMDVSADLHEMARSPMGLVSSGFKSFLDTRRSLELLETLGCTVASLRAFEETYLAGWGQVSRKNDENDELELSQADLVAKTGHLFPGFFTTTCKERVKSPWQCDTVEEAARILYHCLGPSRDTTVGQVLRNSRAMLLACPIPKIFSLDETSSSSEGYSRELLEKISAQIDGRQDLSGNEKTPLILAELNRLTGGKTLAANLELLKNNARIGAHLAYEYALLRQRQLGGAHPVAGAPSSTTTLAERTEAKDAHTTHEQQQQRQRSGQTPRGSPIVIGCTMIDMHVRTKIDDKFKAMPHYSGVTFDGEPHLTLGGVGRNLATAIELLGHEPMFITSLANDNLGQFARAEMRKLLGERSMAARFKILDWLGQSQGAASSCFALVLIDSLTGQCEYVIANLEAKRAISRENLLNGLDANLRRGHTPLVVLDANLPGETMDFVLELCHERQVPIFVEPTDVACLPSLVTTLSEIKKQASKGEKINSLTFLSPNVLELCELVRLLRQAAAAAAASGTGVDSKNTISEGRSLSVVEIEALARELMSEHLPGLACLLVTMDKRGLLVGTRHGTDLQALPGVGFLSQLQVRHVGDKQEIGWDNSTSNVLKLKYYPPPEVIESPVSGSGAGDCFAAGFISGLLSNDHLDECVSKGFKASLCALRDESTVPESLRKLS